ncbi:MAG TPA: hypothetical protein VN719_09520 [Gemmatimonadales bacterium]|nr:hypothetical protein [Gemmatimonadales bacterium]
MSTPVKTWDIWLVTRRIEPPNDQLSVYETSRVAVERGPLDPCIPPANGALKLGTVLAHDDSGAHEAWREECQAEKIRRRRR